MSCGASYDDHDWQPGESAGGEPVWICARCELVDVVGTRGVRAVADIAGRLGPPSQ
jgi:hypothetical protein